MALRHLPHPRTLSHPPPSDERPKVSRTIICTDFQPRRSLRRNVNVTAPRLYEAECWLDFVLVAVPNLTRCTSTLLLTHRNRSAASHAKTRLRRRALRRRLSRLLRYSDQQARKRDRRCYSVEVSWPHGASSSSPVNSRSPRRVCVLSRPQSPSLRATRVMYVLLPRNATDGEILRLHRPRRSRPPPANQTPT